MEAKIFGIGTLASIPVNAARAGRCSYLVATHCCCGISSAIDHGLTVVEYVDFGVVLVDIANVGRYWWLYLIEVVRRRGKGRRSVVCYSRMNMKGTCSLL